MPRARRSCSWSCDGDLDDGAHRSAPVEAPEQPVAAADEVLIGMLEYDYGIPGILKNAIESAKIVDGHLVDEDTASACESCWQGS